MMFARLFFPKKHRLYFLSFFYMLGLSACTLDANLNSLAQNLPTGTQLAKIDLDFNNSKTINLSELVSESGLNFRIETQPSHGTLTGSTPVLTYTPNNNFAGEDSFTFTASRGSSRSTPFTVSLMITDENRIFLRADGDDATGLMGDSSKPFLTAQAAVDAAIAASPSASNVIRIDVGAGAFGDIVVSQDFGDYVQWSGAAVNQSFIGNIEASGQTSNGFNITLNASSTLTFGNITSNGDSNYGYSYGNVGGTITINNGVVCGDLTSNGGVGHYGGGDGGIIVVNGSAGNLTAQGGIADSGNYGSGGNVTINGLAGNVNVKGGDAQSWGIGGGSVTVNGSAGNINAEGYMYGPGGNILVAGVAGNLSVNGDGQFSGGTIVILSGATVANLQANGGNPGDGSQMDGGNGGTITYSLSATIGSTSVLGGLGDHTDYTPHTDGTNGAVNTTP